MTLSTERVATPTLTLPEELILMLLNEESGYFHQVPGWALTCAVVGAALAELSLISRIDTGMDSLILLDKSETGDRTPSWMKSPPIRCNATTATSGPWLVLPGRRRCSALPAKAL